MRYWSDSQCRLDFVLYVEDWRGTGQEESYLVKVPMARSLWPLGGHFSGEDLELRAESRLTPGMK